MVDFAKFVEGLKSLIATTEEPATPPAPVPAPVAPAPDPTQSGTATPAPVTPVASAPPPAPTPATNPEPAPVVIATAKETIIPPAGVVTSAVPTGEAMYAAMPAKELAALIDKEDPALMKLLREPVTGIK